MPILRQERERERERELSRKPIVKKVRSCLLAFRSGMVTPSFWRTIPQMIAVPSDAKVIRQVTSFCSRRQRTFASAISYFLFVSLSLSLSLCPPNYLSFFLPCSTNQPLSFFKRITKRLFFEVVNAIRSFRFKRKCVVTTVEYLSALSHLHGYMG